MSPMKRCMWFDSNGRPYRRDGGQNGCTRFACHFVHPNHPDWDRAVPADPPVWHHQWLDQPITLQDDTHDRSLSKDRHRDRSRSRDRRPSLDSPAARKRSRLDSSSSTAMKRDHSINTRARSPAGSAASYDSLSRRRDRDREPSGSSLRDNPDPHRLHARDSSIRAPSPPPVQFPPSTPLRPASNSPVAPREPSTKPPLQPPAPILPPDPAITHEKRKAAWVERIKLMSDSVTARTDHLKLEQEVRNTRRLLNSRQFESIASEPKTRMQKHLTKIEELSDQKKLMLNDILKKLLESDFWPLLEQTEGLGWEDRYNDVKATVGILREQMDTVLRNVAPQAQPPAEIPLQSPQARWLPVTSQVQSYVQAHGERPAKRPRLSEDALAEAPGRAESASLAEFENLRDRILGLESRIAELENDALQRESFINDELDARIEARVEEAQTTLSRSKNEPDSAVLTEVEQNLNGVGEQIGELADEVGNLIRQAAMLESRANDDVENYQELKKNHATLQEQCQQMVEAHEKTKAEVEALNAAMTLHLAYQPPPPPPFPTIDVIVEQLMGPLQAAVRDEIRPVLQTHRDNVEVMLRDRNTEVYTTIWKRLGLTLSTIESVHRWMEGAQSNGLGAQAINGSG